VSPATEVIALPDSGFFIIDEAKEK